MRLKLTFAYNGAKFFGSQIQPEKTTVNGTLQNALYNLGIDTVIHASGRTDRGVHATRQVAHIDIPTFWKDMHKLKTMLNRQLHGDIVVKTIENVPDDFHARYSAKIRHYRYLLKPDTSANPFENDFVTFAPPLNIARLQNDIKHFIGTHNFCNYSKKNPDIQTTVRTVFDASAYRYKNMTVLHFAANGFLHSQVRLMSAMLLKLQYEDLSTDLLRNTLACTVHPSLKPAQPNGLYLTRIIY
jgi:tRNA pseudouridine38-40 synthase